MGSGADAMSVSTSHTSTSILDASEPDIFGEEFSDAALERAAAMAKDRTASLTIAFCSGLDECTQHLPVAASLGRSTGWP
jgi:Na+-translocating ferredoxin:NAD+ oxidoreductase RNF subunit RnfB